MYSRSFVWGRKKKGLVREAALRALGELGWGHVAKMTRDVAALRERFAGDVAKRLEDDEPDAVRCALWVLGNLGAHAAPFVGQIL